MPKMHVRGDKLTVTIPARIREAVAVHDGDELEVTSEDGRIVLTPVAERHPEIDAALAEALEDERAGSAIARILHHGRVQAVAQDPGGQEVRRRLRYRILTIIPHPK